MEKITQKEFNEQAFKCIGFLNATQSPGADGKLDRSEADRGLILGARALELILCLPEKSIVTETALDAKMDFAGGTYRYEGERADTPLSYEFMLAFGDSGVDVIEGKPTE